MGEERRHVVHDQRWWAAVDEDSLQPTLWRRDASCLYLAGSGMGGQEYGSVWWRCQTSVPIPAEDAGRWPYVDNFSLQHFAIVTWRIPLVRSGFLRILVLTLGVLLEAGIAIPGVVHSFAGRTGQIYVTGTGWAGDARTAIGRVNDMTVGGLTLLGSPWLGTGHGVWLEAAGRM